MATGASGSFTREGWSAKTEDIVDTISWWQEYTPGNNYSDIHVSSTAKRTGPSSTYVSGSWECQDAGGVTVNGQSAFTWYVGKYGSYWNSLGGSTSFGSGTVRVYHTAATSITISTSDVTWYNYSVRAGIRFREASRTVTLSAIPQASSLSMSAGTGSNIGVYRISSPMGLYTGWLGNGAQIFSGDVLQITGNALDGYNFGGLVVNGAAFASGNSITVSGNVTVSASATLRSYQLIGNQATGSWINVIRNGVALSSGATIYHFDILTITAGANSGYELTGLTVNGATFASGGSVTVSGDVVVATTAKQMGLCYIGGEKYQPYICGLNSYDIYQPYIGAEDGSAWILLS